MKKLIKSFLRTVLPVAVQDFLRPYYKKFRYWLHCMGFYFREVFGLPKLKHKQNKINFGFHIVEHCNLKCASCDNFSPLAETEFLNFDDFSRDIERMGILFNHECDCVRLLGGEPLLHPEITKFLKASRENFTFGKIQLLTNGILLANMDKNFWQVCHDYRITIFLTHYPININLDAIESLAESYGVELLYEKAALDYFLKKPINLSGSGNYKVNFELCYRGNGCPLIYHGRLYTCTFAPNVRHFNKKFGVNIPVTDDDSIDIYSGISGDEILRRLCEPIPLCRFCDMNFKQVKWHISEQDINEWL